MTAREILAKALEVLKLRGWCKHLLVNGKQKVCARGAILMACHPDLQDFEITLGTFERSRACRKAEQALLKANTKITDDVGNWNNRDQTTRRTVVKAFTRAIKKAR